MKNKLLLLIIVVCLFYQCQYKQKNNHSTTIIEEDGIIMKCTTINGKKEGLCYEYDKHNRLYCISNWDDGQLYGRTIFFDTLKRISHLLYHYEPFAYEIDLQKGKNNISIYQGIEINNSFRLFQWLHLKNGLIDYSKSEFVNVNVNKDNYLMDVRFYVPYRPSKLWFIIGFPNDNFNYSEGDLDTLKFSNWRATNSVGNKNDGSGVYTLSIPINKNKKVRGIIESRRFFEYDELIKDTVYGGFTKYFIVEPWLLKTCTPPMNFLAPLHENLLTVSSTANLH